MLVQGNVNDRTRSCTGSYSHSIDIRIDGNLAAHFLVRCLFDHDDEYDAIDAQPIALAVGTHHIVVDEYIHKLHDEGDVVVQPDAPPIVVEGVRRPNAQRLFVNFFEDEISIDKVNYEATPGSWPLKPDLRPQMITVALTDDISPTCTTPAHHYWVQIDALPPAEATVHCRAGVLALPASSVDLPAVELAPMPFT